MGWRGTLRSINASIKRAERAQAKRERALLAFQKQQNKIYALAMAEQEVEEYNELIARIFSSTTESED